MTTLAGSAASGLVNGTGSEALFNTPHGLALDTQGNAFVADYLNSVIRKVTPTGVVTTFAGTGIAGVSDGPAATARFAFPFGVAAGSDGSIYVSEHAGGDRIRKVAPDGTVSTLAGGGTVVAGGADGLGTAASFANPSGIAMGNDGVLYVADEGNNKVRRVTSAGLVTTITDSNGVVVRFDSPRGVALDAAGNLYVAELLLVRKVTPGGIVTTLAGNGTSGFVDGVGTAARFGSLNGGIAVDANANVYVSDFSMIGRAIRRIAPDGTVSTFLR